MDKFIRVGIDLGKGYFQVHGLRVEDGSAVNRKLSCSKMRPFFVSIAPCRVGMEACGSAHYWARELVAMGHEVVLMPPGYIKPYVKRGKNDAVDAAAICEAMSRPDMRFVPIKSAAQQAGVDAAQDSGTAGQATHDERQCAAQPPRGVRPRRRHGHQPDRRTERTGGERPVSAARGQRQPSERRKARGVTRWRQCSHNGGGRRHASPRRFYAVKGSDNLVSAVIEALDGSATIGEIATCMRRALGMPKDIFDHPLPQRI